jgi:TP901 family phage tail tape measure protein
VSGATGEVLDSLRDKALQIGKDTSFSASEAASALEELIKAGVSVEDVLNGAADGATALAAAGGVGIPEAATIVSNALNIFSLAGDQATHVADVFAAAANKSATDIGALGQGYGAGRCSCGRVRPLDRGHGWRTCAVCR